MVRLASRLVLAISLHPSLEDYLQVSLRNSITTLLERLRKVLPKHLNMMSLSLFYRMSEVKLRYFQIQFKKV